MVKKLIFSFALGMTLFSFNTKVQAEEPETQEIAVSNSENIMSDYLTLEGESNKLLKDTQLKSELIDMDTDLLFDFILGLLDIEVPTEADSEILYISLQSFNQNRAEIKKDSKKVLNLSRKLEESNYSKTTIELGSVELKETMKFFKESEEDSESIILLFNIFLIMVFVCMVFILIIIPTL